MKFKPLSLPALLMFSLVASAQPKLDESLLKLSFKDLKDPSSVQFRDVRYGNGVPGAWTMCGEFNAKNSFGGYVGFQRFTGVVMVMPKTKKVEYLVSATGDAAEIVCAQNGLL